MTTTEAPPTQEPTLETRQSPTTIAELMARCRHVAGLTLGTLAAELGQDTPENLMHNKGWIGQLIEQVLGAQAGSQPIPDFPQLGIELKTLPINSRQRVQESTYVCVAPLTEPAFTSFDDSVVAKKLDCVLWLPIQASHSIPLSERRVGQGFLWQANPRERQQLARDYDEIAEQISYGRVESITAHQGDVLQLRPKGANSTALTRAIGPDGDTILTLPRGFYLRSQFTQSILDRHLCQAAHHNQ